MGTGQTVRTVQDALADVTAWRSNEEARRKAELVEVDQEMGSLRAALENLRQQLEALEKFRSELLSRDGGLDRKVIERSYEVIFEALQEQAKRVTARAALAAEAERTRSDAVIEQIARSDAAKLFEEYRQFKLAEPSLAAMPESYRHTLLAHHQREAAKLREHVAKLVSAPAALDVEPIEVEVVFGIDAPEGQPELLIAVLPVVDDVHAGWASREEDLQTILAARVVEAIYRAVAEAGPEGAQAMCGGHQGLLAVETELVGARADIGAVLAKHLAQVAANAPELLAAKIHLHPREVDVDYLLPPDDEDEGSQDETVTEATHA